MESKMDSKKVFLLIPDSPLGDKIEKAFYRANFSVMRTNDRKQVIDFLRREGPQALIVDWDFATGRLTEIKRVLKENCQRTPLVLFSKNKKTEERIRALESGADECLGQPSQVEELVAKVKALMRRIDMVNDTPRSIIMKDIEINLDTHEVRKGGKILELTYTQFKILYLLASHSDYVFTRNEILKKVWGENVYVTDRTVDVHVKRLREKLGENKHPSKYIQTIHGLGYRFA